MSSNMPILWQNCLLQYETEIARKAWVWFAETRGAGMCYEADNYASDVEKLVLSLKPMLKASFRIYRKTEVSDNDEVMNDLLKFILIRHANSHFGGNVVPSFLK